eukprot:1031025-Karenia_brevis.AAC.1
MVHLFCHPSWANVAGESSSSNAHSTVPPLPSSDVQTNEHSVDQWDAVGMLSSPSSDARLLSPANVNEEVTVFDDKYWFDQVAILRRENADLEYEKQWAMSIVEQLRGDCSTLQDENKLL